MSRSRKVLYGIGGIIGATLLVSPLVSWTRGAPDLPNTYDPTLSDMSCSETDSELALVSRPAADDEQEVAFLEGIAPAGGDGSTINTGDLEDIPGVILLPGGTILPDGTVLPGGANLPDKTTIAAGPLPNGTLLPSGTNLPGGAQLPGGQSLPPNTELPGGGPPTEVAKLDPEYLLPPDCEGTDCNTEPCIGVDCDQTTGNNDPPPTGRLVAQVPEPASLSLLALGVGLLATRRRRRS